MRGWSSCRGKSAFFQTAAEGRWYGVARYKIVRVYIVPGRVQIQATERFRRAIELGVEKDFHTTDYVRLEDEPSGRGVRVSLAPSKGWLELVVDQLLGR
jgi:hypothetical protein